MAATLIKTQAIGTYSDYYLKLYIEETSISTSANTSSVTVSLYGYTERDASICSWNGSGENSISVTIDGTTNTLSGQNIDTADWRTSPGLLLHSYTKTITHNSDGSKTISVSGSINYKGGGSSLSAGTYSTGSVSQTLTTIARASTVGTVSGTSITGTSGNVTINVSKKNAAYYDKIVTTGAISKTINIGTGSSGTIAWTELLDAMTSTASATLNITVKTYSDSGYSTLVGQNTGSATIKISTSSVKPSGSWSSIIVNSNGLSGKLVAGRSTAKATLTRSAGRGATVSSVTVTGTNCTIASSSSNTYVTNVLPANSSANYSIKFTAVVTDSRGASATISMDTGTTVYMYKQPVVTLTAYRTATGSSTTEDPAGTYAYITYTSTVGASVNGSNSISSTTTSPSGIASGSWQSLPESSTLTVSVTATDAVGVSTTVSKQIPTAKVPLSLYSNSTGSSVGVGIGGSAVADKFKVALPTEFSNTVKVSGGLYVDGNTATAVGTVVEGSGSTTTLASGSATNVCSISLTKGTWLVNAQFNMPVASSDTGRVYVSISTASATLAYSAYTNVAVNGAAQAAYATNLSRIVEVTGSSSTVYMVANQNTGSSKTLTTTRIVLKAVCIA